MKARSINFPGLHRWVTVAAIGSVAGVVVIAIASNHYWIPRSLGGILVIAWIPLMVVLVLSSRFLTNIRIVSGAHGADVSKKSLRTAVIASMVGLLLGSVIVAATYILTR